MKSLNIFICILYSLIIVSCSNSQNETIHRRLHPRIRLVSDSTSRVVSESVKHNSSKDTLSKRMNIEYEKDILVKGYYIHSFEFSGIYPCDSTNPWWVEATRELYFTYDSLMQKMGISIPKYNPTKVFCVLKGSLSKMGHYGHMGGCEYQFLVKEIIRMEKPGDEDCKK